MTPLQEQATAPILVQGTFYRHDVAGALLRAGTPIEELEATTDDIVTKAESEGRIAPRINGKGWRTIAYD